MYPTLEGNATWTSSIRKTSLLAVSLAMIASLLLLTEEAWLPTLQLPVGKTPSSVYFEPNQGQADASINFVGTGAGFKLFLEDGQLRASQEGAAGAGTVDIRFRDASVDPVVTGSAALPGVSHYYYGNDPANWIENVPHFGEVTYEGVYPGINLVLHSRHGNPEYDFVVQPGVDPNLIRLEIAGASEVTLNGDGSLRLGVVDSQPIVMAAPVIYQGDRDNTVEGAYEFFADGSIGFAIGTYDPQKALVIDPELVFSTYVGGEGEIFFPSGLSQGRGADETGAYRCMISDSNNLPGFGPLRAPPRGDLDTVCTKHDPSGQLVYATAIGGTGGDSTLDFTSDSEGRVHITGGTDSSDYPVTPDAFQGAFLGPADGFISSLDPVGQLAFSSYMGGTDPFAERGHSLFAAEDGNLYVGGTTSSLDFLATTGATINRLTPYGLDDNFVVKLDPNRSIEYASLFGGSDFEQIFGIVADSEDSVYTSGLTLSLDFPTTEGAFQTEHGGGSDDGFISKLNSTGTALVYSTYLGGSGIDFPFEGGGLDESGNFYVTGSTESADFPVTDDAYQAAFGGVSDAFIVRFRTDGNGADDLVYSTFLGGLGGDDAPNSEVDRFGNIYLAGGTDSPNFPVTADAFQDSLAGFQDAYIAVLRPELPPDQQLLYASYFGGGGQGSFPGVDFASGLGADDVGNVYLHGVTVNFLDPPIEDLPLLNAFQPDFGGGAADGFLAMFHIWDEVQIDIKPGNKKNEINSKSNGVFTLAILSSSGFDAPTEVDPSTIRLEGAGVRYEGNGQANCNAKDVNKDRSKDLVCEMETNQLNLRPGTPVANMVARTIEGDILMGQDAISLK